MSFSEWVSQHISDRLSLGLAAEQRGILVAQCCPYIVVPLEKLGNLVEDCVGNLKLLRQACKIAIALIGLGIPTPCELFEIDCFRTFAGRAGFLLGADIEFFRLEQFIEEFELS